MTNSETTLAQRSTATNHPSPNSKIVNSNPSYVKMSKWSTPQTSTASSSTKIKSTTRLMRKCTPKLKSWSNSKTDKLFKHPSFPKSKPKSMTSMKPLKLTILLPISKTSWKTQKSSGISVLLVICIMVRLYWWTCLSSRPMWESLNGICKKTTAGWTPEWISKNVSFPSRPLPLHCSCLTSTKSTTFSTSSILPVILISWVKWLPVWDWRIL